MSGWLHDCFLWRFYAFQKVWCAPYGKAIQKSKLDEFAFLKDAKKLETIVFILFLIPGTPKDMLTYVVGTSPMKITQFLVLATFARIPSVISSTFIGSTIRQGNGKSPL